MQRNKSRDLDKIERDDGRNYYVRPNDCTDVYREKIKEWLIGRKPNFLLTANFNTHGTVEYGKNKMTKWYERVHEKLYNKKDFHKIAQKERIHMIGFPELTLKGMLHFHIIANIPLAKERRFLEIGEWQLGRVVPASDLHVKPIGHDQERLGFLDDYVTKGSYTEAFWTGALISRRVCLDLEKRRGAVRLTPHGPWISPNRYGYAAR